ncbi:MAG: signal peptide protein [bacterium]|nr:signal peptide protein [bacterium]
MRVHASIFVSCTLSLLVEARPALAAPYVQCPKPLLTQNATHGTCPGAPAVPCSFNPHDPAASTDPGCQDAAAPNFYDTCKVLIDPITGQASGATVDPAVVCRSITCGDGHVTMADGNDIYIFGFADVTNVPESDIVTRGNPVGPAGFPLGGANFSAPTFFAREGQSLYLTLTNSGMRERPDLFDPHTVHYHGFPNAASVFDGEPMASLSIGLGESLTYYYDNQYAGTYMWHCHVEAAEHMQMGMLGNLYILPAQDTTCAAATPATATMPASGPAYCFKDTGETKKWTGFAFSDGDGSTGYDVMYFLQETAFDPRFHHADQTYQKIPFADMADTYAMFNGRGYPDTVNPAAIVNGNGHPAQPIPAIPMTVDGTTKAAVPATIHAGDQVLLRLSSLSTVDFFTVTALGIPMRVVGQGAQQLRGPTGLSTAYATRSVTLGGGEAVDVVLDTTGVAPGTYFLYTTNLNYLSNDSEDFGGMMTEIVVH